MNAIATHNQNATPSTHPKKRRPKWTDKRLRNLKCKWFGIGVGLQTLIFAVAYGLFK